MLVRDRMCSLFVSILLCESSKNSCLPSSCTMLWLLDWEDVTVGGTASVNQFAPGEAETKDVLVVTATKSPNGVPSSTHAAAEVDDDDDVVEWEDVDVPMPETKTSVVGDAPLGAEDTGASNDEDTDDGAELDESNEMYLSLKNELEDAKAEDDLEELRDEALKSALVTASNLTYVLRRLTWREREGLFRTIVDGGLLLATQAMGCWCSASSARSALSPPQTACRERASRSSGVREPTPRIGPSHWNRETQSVRHTEAIAWHSEFAPDFESFASRHEQ